MNDHHAPLLAGVDTGGTYTDAALIDGATHEVKATAKALTTRGDLAVGVNEALERALALLEAGSARRIRLVAVSTTLATNAVVEGHGSPIAVILIGFDRQMAERIRLYAGQPARVISARIEELRREWSIERYLQINAAAVGLTTAALAAGHDRRWGLVTCAARPRERTRHTPRGAGQHRMHGLSPRALDRKRATARAHDPDPRRAGPGCQTPEITVDDRRDVRVHHGRRCPLVLAELGQDRARHGQRPIRW